MNTLSTTSSSDSRQRALAEAQQAGFDLNLIELNLALSLEERVLRHASALALAQEMRKAGTALHAKPSSPSPTSG